MVSLQQIGQAFTSTMSNNGYGVGTKVVKMQFLRSIKEAD